MLLKGKRYLKKILYCVEVRIKIIKQYCEIYIN